MPPTKEQVLEQVLAISNSTPDHIYAWDEMSLLVMRRLRSSSNYVSKVLAELVEDGAVARIRVASQGYLYLDEGEKRFPGISAPYGHVDGYNGPSRLRITMEHRSGGAYWVGDRVRYYVAGAGVWNELLDKLAAEAREKAARDKEKREVENSMHEAYLEEKVPDYKEVRDALGALFPGIKMQPHVVRLDREKDPRVMFHTDTIKVSELVRLMEVLKRGLKAS